MFRSIHSKILSAQLCLSLFASITLGVTAYLIITSSLKSTEQEKIEYIAQTWAAAIEKTIEANLDLVRDMGESEPMKLYANEFREGLLTQYLAGYSDKFPILVALSRQGMAEVIMVQGHKKILSSSHRTASRALDQALETPNTAFFAIATAQDPLSSLPPPYLDFAFHSELFGEFAGLLLARVPLNRAVAGLAAFRFEKQGFLSIYDSQGRTLHYPEGERVLSPGAIPDELSNRFFLEPRASVFKRQIVHQVDGFTAFAPVTGTNLLVAATLPYASFMATPGKLANIFTGVTVLVVIICFLLSSSISSGISRPIHQLNEMAQGLTKGEWNVSMDVKSSDEIGDLARSFRQMAGDLHDMIRSRDQEIAQRKQVEQAIKISHLELDQIFNTAAGGMLVVDTDFEVIMVNDTFLVLTGMTRQEVLSQYCHDIFPGPECHTKNCILKKIMNGATRVEMEIDKTRPDGRELVCGLVAVPFVDTQGTIIGIILDFRDITVNKRTEELMKVSEKRYRQLFDSAPDGISVLNEQGVIIDCNQSQAAIYGRTRTEIVGRHFASFNTSSSADLCMQNFPKFLESGGAEGEVEVRRADGTLTPLWRKGTPVKDDQFTGVLIYDRDISKLKEAEELREDMARIARHDLKTPLNGIINLPMLIRDEENLTDKQTKYLNLLEEAGYKMLGLINSSLDLYKMEQGTYSFTPVAVNLCPIIARISEELWGEMQGRRSKVILLLNHQAAKEEAAFIVYGDELLCYSMLANLIKNAAEASPPGKNITIHLNNVEGIRLTIHNHGQVAPDIFHSFFEKYTTSGKKRGTGLGTYSARLMARTQGGDITMESPAGRGTTLTVTLPAPAALPGRKPQTAPAPQSHRPENTTSRSTDKERAMQEQQKGQEGSERDNEEASILLAEDDLINQTLVTSLLTDKGVRVTAVGNGREALAAIEKEKFDLILMDMQMPEMDGVETTRAIRQQEKKSGAHMPIIAITGMTCEKSTKQVFDAGIDAFVPKPIQLDLLWESISRFVDV